MSHAGKKNWMSLATGIFLLLVGFYMLWVVFAPQFYLPIIDPVDQNRVAKLLESTPPGAGGHRLYIPKINIDIPFESGDASVLERGAWHRNPENGDPKRGGNFVLSAHRFEMGFTPQHTRAKSPFYNIDKIAAGDKIYVDFADKRYVYTVQRLYDVPRTATEVEGKSDTPKLTLYSCELRGETAGRVVVEATPDPRD